MNPHDRNRPTPIDPDPGTPILRLILVAFWGAICFGAGTLYAPEKKFAACIEVPRKPVSYPVTKMEKAAFIRYYRKDQS